jgi:hypothetical protein
MGNQHLLQQYKKGTIVFPVLDWHLDWGQRKGTPMLAMRWTGYCKLVVAVKEEDDER